MRAPQPPPGPARRRRSLGGARWIAVLAVAFFVAVAWVQIRAVLRSDRRGKIGDGETVASYGFDLTHFAGDRALLVASGMPKDTLTPLDFPRLMSAAAVDSLNRAERGKYLVSDDLVVGVALGGCARAYPVRVLNWHEIANDTLGGRPIAVTWHPLCASAVVFDRRVGNETLSFGQSGLLWNSNLLLYDRRPDAAAESLWLQIAARAVAGPAAQRGEELTVLPHRLETWESWRARHPATTVPWPAPALRPSYKRDPYAAYEGSDLLRFPVAPLPADGRPLKQRVVAARSADGWRVRPYAPTAAGADTACGRQPTIHAYRFAWYAIRGDTAR